MQSGCPALPNPCIYFSASHLAEVFNLFYSDDLLTDTGPGRVKTIFYIILSHSQFCRLLHPRLHRSASYFIPPFNFKLFILNLIKSVIFDGQ